MMRAVRTTYITGIDVGMLVVVDCGAAEGAHGLALCAADENHELVRWTIAHLAGVDIEARPGGTSM